MTRILKFRAWDKQKQQWYGESNPESITFNGFHLFGECMAFCFPRIADLEFIEVMQFTGLLDKHGKEIYEGDVVKYYQPYAKTWHTHIVKWDDLLACFGLFENGDKWCKESDWIKIQEIEIVGNIYQNEELVK